MFTNFSVVCEGFEFTKELHVNLCHTLFYLSRADAFWQRVGGEIYLKNKREQSYKYIYIYEIK